MTSLLRNILNYKSIETKKSRDKQMDLLKNSSYKYPLDYNGKKNNIKYNNYQLVDTVIKCDKEFKQNYILIKKLCERANKAVLLIREKKNMNKQVLKIKSEQKDYNIEDEVENEEEKVFNKLKKHDNPNIIKFISYQKKNCYSYMTFNYFEGKHLSLFLSNNYNILTENDIKVIFRKILSGIGYLHKRDIIHCDIKLDNIIINNNKELKIIDFDLSKSTEDEYISTSVFGTPNYIAPESLEMGLYTKKSDIFSLGILFYNVITLKFPYKSSSTKSLDINNVEELKKPDIKHLKKIISEKGYDRNLIKLIRNMLSYEDYNRPNVNEILNCKWLKY